MLVGTTRASRASLRRRPTMTTMTTSRSSSLLYNGAVGSAKYSIVHHQQQHTQHHQHHQYHHPQQHRPHRHRPSSSSTTMTTTTATPVVLFGLKAAIAQPVIDGLKPEYEVIHFFDSVAAGRADLPRLLAGEQPTQPSAQGLATGNYARPPEAVILGRGFDTAMVAELRDAVVSSTSNTGVPWLSGGLPPAETQKILSGQRKVPDSATYGSRVAVLVKDTFAHIQEQGRWAQDGEWGWAATMNQQDYTVQEE